MPIDPRIDRLSRQYRDAGQGNPINVRPLEYYRKEARDSRGPFVPVWLQFVVGLLLVNACVAVATVIGFHLDYDMHLWGIAACTVTGLVLLVGLIQLATKATGFVPGALAGLLLTPVSFFFACASQFHL